MIDEASKKNYLYKNNNNPNKVSISSAMNYNKVSFHSRKEA